MTNPLLRADALPAFDEIRPEHVQPAIDTLLATTTPPWKFWSVPTPADYDALSRLDTAAEHLRFVWGPSGTSCVADACPACGLQRRVARSRAVGRHRR
jgi:oligopeptidase A